MASTFRNLPAKKIVGSGVGGSGPLEDSNTSWTILNVPVVAANTEYSASLPADTKQFILRSRNRGEIQLAFTVGQSDTNYITLRGGAVYTDNNFYEGLTIYFRGTKNNDVLEILTYQ